LNTGDTKSDAFTPAAGSVWLTPLYDFGIAALTREARWRALLVAQVRPAPQDFIIDVGCGTGSLLGLLARAAPGVRLMGIDPDPKILARAVRKVANVKAAITFRQGFARDVSAITEGSPVTKVVSSLVFHQVPLAEKQAGLGAMYAAVASGGEVHIADYGWQRTSVMRALFRLTVQTLDGIADTEPNAQGVLPRLMRYVGFSRVEETAVIPTITGSISLYRGVRMS
jgi:ubiquinone/menaquinone biosynthesis C-methylase UbiE